MQITNSSQTIRVLTGMLVVLTIWISRGHAQDKTTIGELIIEPPTLISLSFEWYIEGDENRNASVEVEYRQFGEQKWKQALPLLRIASERAGSPEWNYTTPNMFAGSIIDLQEDTEYECRLSMDDPDGLKGKKIRTLRVKTRPEPKPYEGGRVRHVWPNTHNYRTDGWYGFKKHHDDDSINFDGLFHAYYGFRRYADWILTTDPVMPGDIILVHAGIYKSDRHDYRDYHGTTFDGLYALTQKGTAENPIVIKAAGDGDVIFDGNGAEALFNLMAGDHHYIEGITFRNRG